LCVCVCVCYHATVKGAWQQVTHRVTAISARTNFLLYSEDIHASYYNTVVVRDTGEEDTTDTLLTCDDLRPEYLGECIPYTNTSSFCDSFVPPNLSIYQRFDYDVMTDEYLRIVLDAITDASRFVCTSTVSECV
jgi:hypothetical protein